MNITLLTVGKLREPALRELCQDYLGRICRYGNRVEVVEVREEPGRLGPALVMSREAERLRARVPEGACRIALDRAGEESDSPGLAGWLERLAGQGGHRAAFIIGGAFGLERSLVESCDRVLCLSRLTFPHELARLVLLEQLYRACTIQRGEPYHK